MNYSVRLLSGVVLLFAVVTIPTLTHAQSIEGNVELPDNCVVTDKNGTLHTFPKEDSPSAYLAVCALGKALETGLLSSVQFDEFPGLGLFVEGLDGAIAGGDEYWALWLNGAFAECGIECLPLSRGDTASFILTSFGGEERGPRVALHISSLLNSPGTPPATSSGGGEYLQGRTFDIPSAFEFLTSKQNADGSFASALLTDWAAIAFGAADDTVCNDTCKAARQKLRLNIFSAKPRLSTITDYERHAMALISLGINPYVETGTDYITPIVGAFDGTQVGDASLVNDDIFALFPLLHAGYAKTDNMMETILTFILFKQNMNGSWEESVDLTAAAIQALKLFPAQSGVAEAIEKAEQFLHRNQDNSGTFGSNSFSLSWMLQTIVALHQTPDDWKKSGITPLGYLGVLQQEDGGVEPISVGADTRIWATSYAIPAALGKPWDDILGDFARPAPIEPLEMGAVPTSSSPISALVSGLPINETALSATPEPPLTSTNEPVLGTTSEAVTSAVTTDQLASTAEVTGELNTNWLWLAGLLLILFGSYAFVRRA